MNLISPNRCALLCCCGILLAATATAFGQAGQLDSTFGNGGIAARQSVVTRSSNFYSVGAVAIQKDRKIVVAAAVPDSNDFGAPAVVRFLSNGGLDKNFGNNGVARLPNSFGGFAAMVLQPDNKILVSTNATSSADGEVVRFTSAGKLDPTFGTNGAVTFDMTAITGLALQTDGRILVSVQPLVDSKFEVTRLLNDGTVDTSFGTNGLALPPGGNGPLEVLANGEILVFGPLISRLTSSGAIDGEFGVNGQLMAPMSGHALAANGDILAAGALVSDPNVPSSGLTAFAYQSVGIADPAFGKNGGVSTSFAGFPRVSAAGLALESTGSIVETGNVSSTSQGAFGLVRYTPQGQLDSNFGSGGIVTTTFSGATPTASAIAIQSDDKIVIAGTVVKVLLHGQFSTSLVVARYLGK